MVADEMIWSGFGFVLILVEDGLDGFGECAERAWDVSMYCSQIEVMGSWSNSYHGSDFGNHLQIGNASQHLLHN
jgi:hypothetical protein